MCGLTGIFDPLHQHKAAESKRHCRAMSDALAHRGPDADGQWQDEEAGLTLGHRRLSIIDLSPEGAQPMVSASGRYVIAFNGEIYNFQSLQKELRDAGQSFRGRSDTEVMLAAFDQWGINPSLQKFVGMFAFALWDREAGALHLVRDRLGKKPLYIGRAGKKLVFGSELKALCAHPDFHTDIERDVLAQYMQYGFVQAPHCIYEQCWQVPPAHRLVVPLADLRADAGRFDPAARFEPYWSLADMVEEGRMRKGPHDMDAALQEFRPLFAQAVRERLIADVPLGAFLSGGIDSALTVAEMQAQCPRPVSTYTIGFEEAGYDEAAHAREIATHLGTDHHEIRLSPEEAQGVIPDLPRVYDEPFADEAQIPAMLLSRFARRNVTVALTGDGGDELMGGYTRHCVVPPFWQRARFMPYALRRRLGRAILARSPAAWQKLKPAAPRFGENMHKMGHLLCDAQNRAGLYEALLRRVKTPYELVQGAAPLPASALEAEMPKDLSVAEELIFKDTQFYLPHDVLTKLDRASMAYGLECRSPLLDTRLMRWAWRLPVSLKIEGKQGKRLLRRALASYMPDSLFARPKHGFHVPVGEWLRGPLKGWAEDLLSEERMKKHPYLDGAHVRTVWHAHLSGQGQQTQILWNILMFESWCRQ